MEKSGFAATIVLDAAGGGDGVAELEKGEGFGGGAGFGTHSLSSPLQCGFVGLDGIIFYLLGIFLAPLGCMPTHQS